MKSKIASKFETLKNKNKKALIPYITCGDPELQTTEKLVFALEKAGADIIELGIPYSDPLADGPVIQRASQRALKNPITIDTIFEMITGLRRQTMIPLVFLVYYNAVFRYGTEKFLKNCNESGIDGLIIPDLPLEERKELYEQMKAYPVDLIPMAAPTSEARIQEIVQVGSGFVYCISSKGVTGKRDTFENNLDQFMAQVKKHTSIPTAIGFGISGEEAVRKLKGLSDGLIVGSSIIEKIEEGIGTGDVEERVFDFVQRLHHSIE
ncbi:tryptophan synthase subunit alpha [Geosporobacter ferrireducens]|uniref:Tryptophan synthase alpha chain n=1 Tax=Geosporobacter ferrireducens TaxID=1424294 RepID=A0A1D8GEC9_9FIRM|nr:tryptophan synthase subunit alpha [Geosporobacter ferrireducens]AOT69256.1 tryptophan synthase subunit alpha [Geosporobacter ferrireducens]MTI56938.1 tryptophan synthase subunit alpha [Geosporobacter ferrireducens]